MDTWFFFNRSRLR